MNHWELKPLSEKPRDAIVFPTQRGLQSYRNLREAVEKIYGSYQFSRAQELVEALGAYQLEDALAARLRRSGLALPPDGEVVSLSMRSYLDEAMLERAREPGLGIQAIRARLEALPVLPRKIYLAPESVALLTSFLRVWNRGSSTWEQLECIDALECHRNPLLAFS